MLLGEPEEERTYRSQDGLVSANYRRPSARNNGEEAPTVESGFRALSIRFSAVRFFGSDKVVLRVCTRQRPPGGRSLIGRRLPFPRHSG